MNMRTRFILIIISVLALSGFATWLATEYIIKSQYLKIENENMVKDTARVINAFEDKIDRLAQKTPDWSSWDDTYNFIDDKNEAYIESNLQSESLQSLGINFMLFYDTRGELVFSKGVNTETGEDIEVPKEFLDALGKDGIILAKDENHQLKGIINTSTDPLLISARPILNSDFKGPPKGTLIFAQYLNSEDIKQLSELTKLDIEVKKAVDENSRVKSDVAQYSSTEAHISIIDSENIVGRQLINDIYTRPLLLVSVKEPRAIMKEAQETLIFYILVVMGFSAIATITVLNVTRRVVEQTKTLEIERALKQEMKKQVVDRTRQAEEEQARLRSAMDGLEAGLLITFNDRRRVLYNPALVNILGLQNLIGQAKQSKSEITLEKIVESIEPNIKIKLVQEINKCLEDGKTFQFKEIQYNDKVLSIFGAPIIMSLDKIIGTVVLVEDITEAKVV